MAKILTQERGISQGCNILLRYNNHINRQLRLISGSSGPTSQETPLLSPNATTSLKNNSTTTGPRLNSSNENEIKRTKQVIWLALYAL